MIILNSQLTINYLQDTVNQSYGTLVTQFSIFICIIRFPVYGTSIASYLHTLTIQQVMVRIQCIKTGYILWNTEVVYVYQ